MAADLSQLAFAFDDPPSAPASAAVAPSAPARRERAKGFNYTNALQGVIADVVGALEEFRHVDLTRVGVSLTQARQQSKHGTYATCVPLRFQGGAREQVQRGRTYRMQTAFRGETELLYLLYFVLPRFHVETDYREKLATIIHELYHISPRFDGDLRRFPGKNFAHGHSRERYHEAMRALADRYLASAPRAGAHDFLHRPFEELMAHPGGIVGQVYPRPRAVLVKD